VQPWQSGGVWEAIGHTLSANLIQLWLMQYDRGELSTKEAEASGIAE